MDCDGLDPSRRKRFSERFFLEVVLCDVGQMLARAWCLSYCRAARVIFGLGLGSKRLNVTYEFSLD